MATHRSLNVGTLGSHIPIYLKRLPASMIERLHLIRPPWGADGTQSTFNAFLLVWFYLLLPTD
eukprot:6094669-Pyramimonas_sp.AAC.1